MTTEARPTGPGAAGAKVPRAKTKFGGVVVMCAKCVRRQGLRPKAVRGLLKQACKDLLPPPAGKVAGKGRKLCIVESGCLGPCPKRAVAVATGRSLAAGRTLLLDPAGGAESLRAALLPEFGPNAALADKPNPAGPSRTP